MGKPPGPWIESHSSLADHPKLVKVAASLGLSEDETIGKLHRFWWWAQKYAPDGDLDDYSPPQLAAAFHWGGAPSALVDALLDAGPKNRPGFLERAAGRLSLHDWDLYTEGWQDMRERNAQRQRDYRARKRAAKDAKALRDSNVTPNSDSNVTSHTPITNANVTVTVQHDRTGPDMTGHDHHDVLTRKDHDSPVGIPGKAASLPKDVKLRANGAYSDQRPSARSDQGNEDYSAAVRAKMRRRAPEGTDAVGPSTPPGASS